MEYLAMRCPKCGYTSFDNLERCKRCKKNIAATAAALMGTTVDAIPPFFLMPKEADDTSVTAAAAGANISLNKGAAAAASPTDKAAARDETPALPESNAAAAPDPALNLSGVDISDLKAPAAEAQAAAGPVDDFSLEDLQLGDDELAASPKAAPAAARPAPPPPTPGGKVSPAAKTGTALDSFNFDDLDELLVADEKP